MTDASAESSYVLAGTPHDTELRRLQLIEADFDFYCQSRLKALGLAPGARCLEAGVGAGSMARWMAAETSPGGQVVGVDLNDRYFGLSAHPALDLRKADIREIKLPDASFDFIHARCFVMHIPDAAEVVKRFFNWLKPGGWLVLADWDFSFHHRSSGDGDLYNRLVDETVSFVAALGGNVEISMSLPYLLNEIGFDHIDANGAFPVVLPWNNQPEFLALSLRTVQPIYQVPDVTDDDYDAFERSLPGSMQTGHTLVTVWGQRPSAAVAT